MAMIYYVVDTNVIIDYTGIIPNGKLLTLDSPSVNLGGQCLVVPVAVVNELGRFKNERTDRGRAAREALNRLSAITERENVRIEDVNTLKKPIMVETGGYYIKVLPVNERFGRAISFEPSKDDMDGQIILATLATLCDASGVPANGRRIGRRQRRKLDPSRAVLLTNDRGMGIRARAQGLLARQFRYNMPAPYTGRRDLQVPDKLYQKFFSEGRLTVEEWERAMPKEEPLVENEFLIMYPESGEYPGSYTESRYLHIGRYDASSQEIKRIKHWLRSPVTPRNAGQAILAEALVDKDIDCVICTGPAGTGKTYMTTVCGYDFCKQHRYKGVIVVPCYPEEQKHLGALPGDLDAKMDPTVRPHKMALLNFFLAKTELCAKYSATNQVEPVAVTSDAEASPTDENGDEPILAPSDNPSAETQKTEEKDRASARKGVKNSKRGRKKAEDKKKSPLQQAESDVEEAWKALFRNIPVFNARGLSFPEMFVLYDEFQDQNRGQALTLLTRIGAGSKMVITGDVEQIHAAYLDRDNNGLVIARQVFKGEPRVAQVTFLPSEVVRHALVQCIIERAGKI